MACGELIGVSDVWRVEKNGFSSIDAVCVDTMHGNGKFSIGEPLILKKVEGGEGKIDDETSTNCGGWGCRGGSCKHGEGCCVRRGWPEETT